jgi:hypothetical protein
MSTTTSIRGWRRRKESTDEITRFPRVEQPTQPSARRVAAAKRAAQAERDRYPLFPELVRYSTMPSRLDAMQEHRITWWQELRNHVAASRREARASLRSLTPGPRAGILRYWQTCSLPGHPSTSLACCTTTGQENAVFATPWPNCASSN